MLCWCIPRTYAPRIVVDVERSVGLEPKRQSASLTPVSQVITPGSSSFRDRSVRSEDSAEACDSWTSWGAATNL
jgi:hypothetical protein